MSWLAALYETYENNLHEVGKTRVNRFNQEYTLIPISHTTQTAHIEVTVTEEGDFHSATVIDRNQGNTIIPTTEKSANRAGLAANRRPYPLHDKLSFVAGDFIDYAGKIRDEEPYQYYIELLEKWVKSPYATKKLKSIYRYIIKKQLVKDLIQEEILAVDGEGKLIDKWNRKYEKFYEERPKIFSVAQGGQYSAFIRFNVHSPNEILTDVWNDQAMYESFINFYNDSLEDEDFCYVTGKYQPTTDMHANKIRNAGDKAKLISANDTSGFTFRGRFTHSYEVASISYDVSQKAHNSLKWLIQKQGRIIDNRVFLIWSNEKVETLDAMDDGLSLHAELYGKSQEEVPQTTYTAKEFAREFSKAIDGYKHQLDTTDQITILVLDSATTGRMAVLYYRQLDKDLYFERIKHWHTTCFWRHRYRKDENENFVDFYGAPATRDIAFAAYGDRASNKLVKGVMKRILPCIIDQRDIPKDIVRSAFHRASNPVGMERWEWEKTLSITCALINKEEEIGVGLNEEIKDRDYLFGRLLAIADVLERSAHKKDENRATNAIRYMNSFSKHPERTWKTIQANLQPYQERLANKGIYLSSLIDEVASKIKYEDFNNKPLSGKFLLGFYSQRHELYQSRKNKNEEEMN
ncbi:MAG TPA: type I-C CRISPR-associated protein Cas8c/Csd1 [Pseudogracilibacillus sp.]|nr:type I-C CRISPR-associated protein Cas8c/Csd1 [Pseudogracilibacillus sp.]